MAWGARTFPGGSTNDVVQTALTKTTPFSLAAWCFQTTLSQPNVIFDTNGSSSSGNLNFFVTTSGGNGTIKLDKKGIVNIITGTTKATAGVWQHLGVSYDGTNAALYLAGAPNGTATNTQTINAANGIMIGNVNTQTLPFAGSVADAAIWNAILSPSEFAALGKGARPTTIRPALLVGYWPLGGQQSPEPDLSGGKFNGTVTGTSAGFGPPFAPQTPRWPRNIEVAAIAPRAGAGRFNMPMQGL